MLITAFGPITNQYDNYLATGQPLKADDDELKVLAGRYLFRGMRPAGSMMTA